MREAATKTILIAVTAVLCFLTNSPCPPDDQRYDDDLTVHPMYDLHDIGTQNQGLARNNATDNNILDNALTQCPQVMGMGYLSDGRMIMVTQWDHESDGPGMEQRMFSRMYIYSKDVQDLNPGSVSGRQISELIYETSSMIIMNDTIWLAQKTQLVFYPWKNADEMHIINQTDLDQNMIAPIPMTTSYLGGTANFQEYPLGLLYRDGKFYIANSSSVHHGGMSPDINVSSEGFTDVSGVGSVLSIDRYTGEMDVIATGLRAHDALGWGPGKGPDGEDWGPLGGLYTVDNQGSWKPCSPIIHVRRGDWHYYPRPTPDIWGSEPANAAIWMPHGDIGRSPTDIRTMPSGPYKNQLILGDVSQGGLKRAFLEEVGGEMQGSVHSFSGGFSAGPNRLIIHDDGSMIVGHIGNGHFQNWGWMNDYCGFQMIVPNGSEPPFEMLAVRSRKNGMEIEFTQPVDDNASVPANWNVRRYEMIPVREYGQGHKMFNTAVSITSAAISSDRMRVFLEIDIPSQIYRDGSLKKNTIVDVRLTLTADESNITSAGVSARTPAAWYTINHISDLDAFPKVGCMDAGFQEYDPEALEHNQDLCVTVEAKQPVFPSSSAQILVRALELTFPGAEAHSFRITDTKGKEVFFHTGTGSKSYSFKEELRSGIYFLKARTAGKTLHSKLVVY